MSLWDRLFGRKRPGEARGYSPRNPLLASSPADERAVLDALRCPSGHAFRYRRLGSLEGRCPEPASHENPFGGDGCIVDKYQLECSEGDHACTLYFDMYHPRRGAQEPPDGLRQVQRRARQGARTITLHYEEGVPAWQLSTVQPSRFKEVRYEVQARIFRLREGALLGILLNLYDIPDQPYFVHRIMDLSDPEVLRYVEACGRHGRIVTVFEPKGVEEGFKRELDLDSALWQRCLLEGRAHNAAIHADGDRALESFLEVFQKASRERGVEHAWDEVDRRLVPRDQRRTP